MNIDQLTDFLRAEWRELTEATLGRDPTQSKPDEADLIKRAGEGQEARRFLESRVVQDFMARVEAQLTQQLLALPLADDQGRRNLAVAIQTQRQLMRYLLSTAEGGQSAERELQRLQDGPRKAFF